MIDALISGTLIRDPSTRTGASGKPFCNFLLSAPVGGDEPAAMVSGIAFAEAAEKIGRLKKGDALSVVGGLKPTTWQDKATGETRHGLNITVQACLTAYDVKKRRGGTEAAGPSDERGKGHTEGLGGFVRSGGKPTEHDGGGWDDPVEF
jgi:single-strand DNA-binding protein